MVLKIKGLLEMLFLSTTLSIVKVSVAWRFLCWLYPCVLSSICQFVADNLLGLANRHTADVFEQLLCEAGLFDLFVVDIIHKLFKPLLQGGLTGSGFSFDVFPSPSRAVLRVQYEGLVGVHVSPALSCDWFVFHPVAP